MSSYWQLGDELRGLKVSEEHKWLMAASKLAEQTRSKVERMNNLDLSKGLVETRLRDNNVGLQEENKFESLNFNMLNLDSKSDPVGKSAMRNGIYSINVGYQKNNLNTVINVNGTKHNGNNHYKDAIINNCENGNSNSAVDKRFKTLPAAETLPRDEVLGGYIFVCNNDTMQEDLKRQLFGNNSVLSFSFFLMCNTH